MAISLCKIYDIGHILSIEPEITLILSFGDDNFRNHLLSGLKLVKQVSFLLMPFAKKLRTLKD